MPFLLIQKKPIEFILGIDTVSSTLLHSKGRIYNMTNEQLNLFICDRLHQGENRQISIHFERNNHSMHQNWCVFCTSGASEQQIRKRWGKLFMRMITFYYVFTPVDPTLHSNSSSTVDESKRNWIPFLSWTSKHFIDLRACMAFHNQVPLLIPTKWIFDGKQPKEVTQSS